MASSEFEVGDIVNLKSGGLDMTVHKPNHDGKVYCVWFDGQLMQGEAFAPKTLKKKTEVLCDRCRDCLPTPIETLEKLLERADLCAPYSTSLTDAELNAIEFAVAKLKGESNG